MQKTSNNFKRRTLKIAKNQDPSYNISKLNNNTLLSPQAQLITKSLKIKKSKQFPELTKMKNMSKHINEYILNSVVINKQ